MCKAVANETSGLRNVLKRVENVRKGWDAVKRRLQTGKTRLLQQSNEFKALVDKVYQKSTELRQYLQSEET